MAEENKKYSDAGMALLKANLGYYSTDIPADLLEYLKSLLGYAFDDFAEMGIHLDPGKLKDDMDQMTHAAWMYRSGVNGNGKTEMLKSIIRNRQVGQALAHEEASA